MCCDIVICADVLSHFRYGTLRSMDGVLPMWGLSCIPCPDGYTMRPASDESKAGRMVIFVRWIIRY